MQTSTNRRGALASLAKAAAATGALSAACAVSQCSTKAEGATINRSAWDRARRNYECRRALQEAVEKFGALAQVSEKRQLVHYEVKERFGTTRGDRVDAAAKRKLDAAYEAEQRVSDKWMDEYVYPTEAAAIALLLTPAPDIEALQFKMRVIEKEELHLSNATPRDCCQVLHEDVARVGGLN